MNTKFKNAVVRILTSKPFESVGEKFFGNGIPIFMLHRVSNNPSDSHATHSEYLRKCLDYLVKNDYNLISLYELVSALKHNKSLPDKSVAFTIDDGFDDQASIAAPIFLEYDCPVTIFLITGMLDNNIVPWDDKIAYLIKNSKSNQLQINIASKNYNFELNTDTSRRTAINTIRNKIKVTDNAHVADTISRLEEATNLKFPDLPPEEYKPLTWDLVREYENKGIDFSPHTISHRILSKLDETSMKNEILGSWKRLTDELNNPKPIFCYPTGRFCDFGPREVRFLSQHDFIGAVSTMRAQVRPRDINDYYLYSLPRLTLPNSYEEFIKYCSWIEYVKDSNLRLWS